MADKVQKLGIPGEDPAVPFYLAVSIGNLDGSLDHIEGTEGIFETEAQAVECLSGLNEEYPNLEGWVYHCIPVQRVWRGKIRVTPVSARKAPRRSRGVAA